MSIICPIYKKRNPPMDVTNYSEIPFFTKCYKMLSISVPNVPEKYTNNIIGNYRREIKSININTNK